MAEAFDHGEPVTPPHYRLVLLTPRWYCNCQSIEICQAVGWVEWVGGSINQNLRAGEYHYIHESSQTRDHGVGSPQQKEVNCNSRGETTRVAGNSSASVANKTTGRVHPSCAVSCCHTLTQLTAVAQSATILGTALACISPQFSLPSLVLVLRSRPTPSRSSRSWTDVGQEWVNPSVLKSQRKS